MARSLGMPMFAVLVIGAAAACRPSEKPQPEAPAASATAPVTLRDAFLRGQQVWNAGDIAAIGAGIADDMIQLQPGKVVAGKEAVLAAWRELLAANTDVWSPTIRNAQEGGNLGFVTASFTETSTPKAGGAPSTMEGLSLAVFRRDANGAWEQTLDSWYTPPITALTSLPGRGPLTAEAEAVKKVFTKYMNDWNAANMDAVAELLDANVVQITTDTAFVGKDALMADWRKLMAENRDVWTPVVLDVQVSGDLAYLMYSGEEVTTPKAGGAPRAMIASGWEIFRRDASGAWKLVNETFFSRPR